MMTNMKHIKLLIAYSIAFMAVGCSDFLEPKATSEYTPKDAQSLSELLLGNAYPTPDVSISTYMQVLDDDVTGAPYQATVDYDMNGLLGIYTWQPYMYEWLDESNEKKNADLYYIHYSKILGANAVYEQANKIEDSDHDLQNYVKAQALTLRAFYFLNLVNIYCMPFNEDSLAMGVPLKVTSSVEQHNLSRPTVAENYRQIEADLLESVEIYEKLPASMQWSKNFRTSLPLAQILLSRTYLYMEKWEKAAEYAKKVMDNKSFVLTNLNSLDKSKHYDFHSYTATSENIWLYGNLVSDCCYWVYLVSKGAENRPFLRASDELMDSFDEYPGDLRSTYYIIRTNYTYLNRQGEEELMPAAYGKVNTSSTAGKEWQPMRVVSDNTFARSFRVSEAYLNYCEAMAMLYKNGNATAGADAQKVLNTFRSFRYEYDLYQKVDFANADDLVEFIRRERRREFCFEDMRWNDLRRWGMPEIKHVWYPDANTKTTYTLKAKDPQYCIPLPPDALELNSELKQNTLGEERTGTNETIN